jgi:hypothetical protein
VFHSLATALASKAAGGRASVPDGSRSAGADCPVLLEVRGGFEFF